MTLAGLDSTPGLDYLLWDFWATNGTMPTTQQPLPVTFVSVKKGTFVVPKSPPPSPVLPPSSAGTYQVLSPILSSGWAILGEEGKIVAASGRRFSSISAGEQPWPSLEAVLGAANNESVVLWVLPPASTRSQLLTGDAAEVVPLAVRCPGRACAGEDCEVYMTVTCHGGVDSLDDVACACEESNSVAEVTV